MRQSVLTSIILTLLMLLLVAAAAFIFLFQGRQTLEERVTTLTAETSSLEQELSQTASTVADMAATRDVVVGALATAESNTVLLEGELVENQRLADELTDDLADKTAELETANSALSQLELAQQEVLAQPPLVDIVSPADGAAFPPDEPITFVIAASNGTGANVADAHIAALHLTINDDTIASYTVDDEPLFAAQVEWLPPEEGAYLVSALALNVMGQASEPMTITIQVVDIEARNIAIRTQIENNVIALRGLTPLEPIEPTLLTREALRQQIETEFAQETTPEAVREDALVLSAFDFLDRDYDLYQAIVDLQSEAISGYYDPETAEFVVISDDDELDVEEQWTHAHEFVHALQDQYYPLELISDGSLDSEASTALRALVEGEATLVQLLYLTEGYFDEEQTTEIIASLNGESEVDLDAFPPILIRSLAFSYDVGFEFVLELYNGGDLFAPGDFTALDEVWDNLPQSTEQILHPERYLSGDVPQLVALPPLTETLGAGWQQLDNDVLGEFFLREYLGQQLSENEVELAATGWGGDRYLVYWHETEAALVMVLRLVWDSPADQAEFNTLYARYPAGLYGTTGVSQPDGSLCWQGEDVICLYQEPAASVIVRAPDVATAVLVAGAIPAEE